MASITYAVADNWGSGFVGNMTVSAGSQALQGWTIEFDATFDITNLWGAVLVSHVGNHYVLRNAEWNAAVPAGGTASFGFQASTGSGGTAATGLSVNGAGTSPPPVVPTLSIADASIGEGNAGTSELSFTVTLSQAATGPVTVQYATGNGTATAGSDYAAKTGTLTFAAGETSKVIKITVTGDTAVEANETLTVTLSGASGASLARAAAIGSIVNDDVAPPVLPTLSIADASIGEGNTGTVELSFTVTLSQAATGPVTVQYATGNGTASAGSDYTAKTGTLTFAAGETSKVIKVTVTGDTAVEANESLTLTLSGASGATLARGLATGTIVNDDTTPPPTGSVSLTYTIASNWGSGFTADMKVGGGSAALNGWTVEFNAAFTITNIWNAEIVSHIGDHYVIRNASWNSQVAAGQQTGFGFQASAGSSGTQASGFTVNGTAVGQTPPPLPTLSVADATVSEGNSGSHELAFTVALSAAASGPVSVGYATANGSATAGSDYTAQSGTLTFAAGETSKVVRVTVTGDTAVESNETLSLRLSAPGGATIARGTAIGTIVNDDTAPAPTLSIGDASFSEGSAATPGRGTFTVTLSAASAAPVSVNFATANGTALAGSDYVAQSGMLTFAAGETSKTITVTAVGDAVVEANESLSVVLSNPAGATLARATGAGTIVNDDTAPTPALGISDASFNEGSAAAPGHATFTVTLSAAATAPVTVNFATANGTALAGSDYVATSGTLTFAAGETSKTITVNAIGDAVVEPNEGFTVVLSNPAGATLADATGAATIVNDDVAPPVLPTLGIADASAIEGNPGSGGGVAGGWLSTSGNQIVDSSGQSVQIAGVNWFGFESSTLAPHGLWTRGYKDMMQQMSDLGFNTIRLPFSSEMLDSTAAPNGIDFSKNPDLQGLSALQIMDKIVDYAGQLGLKIILDHHRSDSGAGTSGNGLWYDGNHSQAEWVSDWQMLATRYASKSQVIGADLHNEPYNGTWGGGGPNDWAAAAELAGRAIGTVNPNWLIFVEGVGTYQGQSYWWGGNLMGVKDRPIQLTVPNKLVYSAHDYPNSIYPQPWFQGADFPANLPAKFDQMWGYIYKQGIAPVYIGEFGTKLTDPKDAPWFDAITSYLAGDLNNDGTRDIPAGSKGVSWTFWSWNPNSGDTGGILKDDWNSVNQNKMNYLTPIEYDFGDGGSAPASHADFVLTLSQAATTAITVDFHTVTGEATAADFTGSSGSVTFAPGEKSKTISIAITPDSIDEANEHFAVVLSNAQGATITRATGTGTIVDDDVAAASQTTTHREFSPYIDMAMSQDADLAGIAHASGIDNFTLAFVLSSDHGIGWQGVGGISDDGLVNGSTILQQVQAVQAMGGNITISFGGAAGQEAALTATSAQALQAAYQSVIDRYHVDSLDFDIEGAAVANTVSLHLRDQALVGLQAANPDLKISFTLPVLPTGLDYWGLNVLRAAQQDGVRVDVVNIMAMDYGAAVDNNGQMGLNAILAAEATQAQLQILGLDAKIGMTPMIGVNDIVSEVFTQSDAQALLAYAQNDPDVVRLSMWSVAR
ncbi:MAG TPA: Calx-beta domain-containing protein, partial [Reyranella sp.]|nr:Calx-beta domain-containing protein [Reyranella sp.]